MTNNDERLARIERAVRALGGALLTDATWGSEYQARRAELRDALAALDGGSGASDLPTSAAAETTATGAALRDPTQMPGQATDPIPPNQPTVYLPGQAAPSARPLEQSPHEIRRAG